MNFFVVSHQYPKSDPQQLICELSRIHIEHRKTVPVIVVDDRYNLAQLPDGKQPTDHTLINLQEMLNDLNQTVDPTKVAQRMSLVDSHWAIVELGHHDQLTCASFVRSLSHYHYLNPSIGCHNLVFMAPAIYLSALSRLINESFNNQPASGDSLALPGEIKKLFMIMFLEKAFRGVPLLASLLIRLRQVATLIFRRFAKAG